jgi:hypothetical protein
MTVYNPNDAKNAPNKGNRYNANGGGHVIENLYTSTLYSNLTSAIINGESKKSIKLGTIDRYEGRIDHSDLLLVQFFIWIDGNDSDNTPYIAGGKYASMFQFEGVDLSV